MYLGDPKIRFRKDERLRASPLVRWLLALSSFAGCVSIFAIGGGRMAAVADLPAVRYLPDLKLWMLDTARTSYVMGLNEENELQSVYWGEKLAGDQGLAPAHTSPEAASFDSSETMTNLEYPGWGGQYYNEPA